jgi:hypothetical protein
MATATITARMLSKIEVQTSIGVTTGTTIVRAAGGTTIRSTPTWPRGS